MESFVFWGFNLYAWITILTVLTMFTVLLLTKLRADVVFLGAISILFVTGVLNAKEAFSGFIRCRVRFDTYGCTTMDREEPARSARKLF